MGWFLWGVAFGWAVCATFYYSMTDNEKAGNAAFIILVALGIMALIVSVALGYESGAFPPNATPTPDFGGR